MRDVYDDEALADLNEHERLFVLAFTDSERRDTFLNPSASLVAAGYAGDPAYRRQHAGQVKRRPRVQRAIRTLISSHIRPVHEVFSRLSDMIDGAAAELFEVEVEVLDGGERHYSVELDVGKALSRGFAHLVESYEHEEISAEGVTRRRVKVTMPSSLAAIKTYLSVFAALSATLFTEDEDDDGGEFWRQLQKRLQNE